MVHEPLHIVHLFTAHSVNFIEFQIIVIYIVFLQKTHFICEYLDMIFFKVASQIADSQFAESQIVESN
jgi:hypothetical protein